MTSDEVDRIQAESKIIISALIQIKLSQPENDAASLASRDPADAAEGGVQMHDFAEWLAGTALSRDIQVAGWILPLSQSLHILAVAMLLSSMLLVDLRILGVAAKSETMTQMSHRFAPWVWTSLVLLAATGTLQIIAEPMRTLNGNPMFEVKMLMLAFGIVVLLSFQSSLRRHTSFWDDPHRRTLTRVLAGSSFLLWCAIVITGRWIAYFQGA
jgi:hypothetical protein